MENAMLIGLSRQMALSRELDVIANNVANIETGGFKRRSSIFQEYLAPGATADAFPRSDKRLSYVLDRGTALDLSQGAVSKTGNPLDVAIRGDALFSVRTPQGVRYTRDGSFSINSRGELVNAGGHQVMTDQGPVTLTNDDHNVAIAADGQISTSLGTKGRLQMVQFADPQSLRNEGSNEFSSTATPNPAAANVTVEAGAVEKSNVNPVLEMSRLIEVNRSYTDVTNAMTQMDTLRGTAIQKLADISS